MIKKSISAQRSITFSSSPLPTSPLAFQPRASLFLSSLSKEDGVSIRVLATQARQLIALKGFFLSFDSPPLFTFQSPQLFVFHRELLSSVGEGLEQAYEDNTEPELSLPIFEESAEVLLPLGSLF